jgi:hypothetical protein
MIAKKTTKPHKHIDGENEKEYAEVERLNALIAKANSTTAENWEVVALEALAALHKLNSHYDDLSKSNPGFLGKLCLQNYALMNEAFCDTRAVLTKYARHLKGNK